MTKKLAIFGSTGSIGRQTLEVLKEFPEEFTVTGLTAKNNAKLLAEQVEMLAADGHKADGHLGLAHKDALIADADYIVNGLPGFAGLEVSVAALRAGKTLLSANKESLAIAGTWLREIADETGATILPLDSEASAVWQLMHRHGVECLSSVTLTCSGGPFFGKKTEQLKDVTVEQALAHPTWKMGKKVSVDSATLINKILEVYELHKLFDIPLRDIKIMIHPQSLVHGMIHTKTGATKMHITQNDMRLFISYALHYPEQPLCPWPIERTRKSELEFFQPDAKTFRPLAWFELHKGNPNFPIVLNALNDIATARFLAGRLSFLGIYEFIEIGLNEWLWELPSASLADMIKFHQKITNHYEKNFSERHSNFAGGGKVGTSRA